MEILLLLIREGHRYKQVEYINGIIGTSVFVGENILKKFLQKMGL